MTVVSEEIVQALRESEFWGPKAAMSAKAINGLLCPACGQPEAFVFRDRPFSIHCHRNRECGQNTRIRDVFPALFAQVEKRHKPTKADPDAPATAFLALRGIPREVLAGVRYKYERDIRGTGSGGVMFYVGRNTDGAEVWNGRLFNPPPGEGKTHNRGATRGMLWAPGDGAGPPAGWRPSEEVFVTEGIIDALSFAAMGFQAVAVLSCGADPASVNLIPYGKPVLAFDADKAGRRATRRWKAHYQDAAAILPARGADWNDFLMRFSSAEAAKEAFEARRPEFAFNAALALATNAQEYAQVWNNRHGGNSTPGLFEFDGCYWWSQAKTTDKETVITTRCVSNFTLDVDHFQLDSSIQDDPSHRFHLVISTKSGRPTRCTVTAEDLTSPTGLATMFLRKARAVWTGDRLPSLAIMERIAEAQSPVVRQLNVSGFDSITRCYVFERFMVDPSGKISRPDRNGFFQVSRECCLRPARYQMIPPADKSDPAAMWGLVRDAWGDSGAVAIAWTWASWWVNQIKAEIGFFPFLSLWGDPGTGKSRLARLCNAMQGLDEEGLPMNKVNTAKGEVRKLAQVSGMFRALLEGSANGAKAQRFDLDSILPLYNINPLQTTALKTQDNQTRELPFLAAMMFVQNPNLFTSRPQKERVVSLKFLKDDQTPGTAAAYNSLLSVSPGAWAAMHVGILRRRADIEAGWMESFARAREDLAPSIPDARLCDNHAIILAWHRMISALLGISHDLTTFLQRIGSEKYTECFSRQEDVSDYILGTVINLSLSPVEENENPCYEIDDVGNVLYLHLARVLKALKDRGYPTPGPAEAIRALKGNPAFVKNLHLRRLPGRNSPERLWVFDIGKILSGA